ncbi:hypothetical protein EV641_109234 [Rhodococcus sp. SMB37]|uniref:hypothetical protein n=1 Tax=Rhodococcus sp. SMB37 TaxID=2512213 RepID=UPI00104805A3|nr:hypothetical protein [Rhodococcus sp. SMB37]TCN51843.1 hypothetical protein EV641_109234 [Rhodococcus sp. SMB37]
MNETRSIAELLDLAVERHGTDSGRELERIAQAGGHKIVHTTINAIRAGTYKSTPSERTLKAIAYLADVKNQVAFEAAGRKPLDRPFVNDLPPGVDDLSPKERRVAVEMLRLLVSQRHELDGIGKAPDSTDEKPGLSLVPDPADTLAARKGRTQADIEDEELDRWDGIDTPAWDDDDVDPPGPDEGV